MKIAIAVSGAMMWALLAVAPGAVAQGSSGEEIRTPFDESAAQQAFRKALLAQGELGIEEAGWLSDMDLYVAVARDDESRELAKRVCRLADEQRVALQTVKVVDVGVLRGGKRFEQLASASCIGAPQM